MITGSASSLSVMEKARWGEGGRVFSHFTEGNCKVVEKVS